MHLNLRFPRLVRFAPLGCAGALCCSGWAYAAFFSQHAYCFAQLRNELTKQEYALLADRAAHPADRFCDMSGDDPVKALALFARVRE